MYNINFAESIINMFRFSYKTTLPRISIALQFGEIILRLK